jgi:hypothetical protein
MGRAAEAKSNVDDVTVPAGEYFLGDPSYAIEPHEVWMHLLESCNYFEKPIGQLPDGTEVIAFNTAYGDGYFPDDHGNMYPVDAGLIGLVPVTPATEAALAEQGGQGYPGPLMTRVSFDEPALCTRTGRGLLTFGPYRVDTAGDELDEDDEAGADFAAVSLMHGDGHAIQAVVTPIEFPFVGERSEDDVDRAAGEMSSQFDAAMNHPGGPREYWRDKMVGKSISDRDGHVMTSAEYDAAWDAAEAVAEAERIEHDRLNEEAQQDPRGPKEFWRERVVGIETYGEDDHPMTNEEFEAEWAEREAEAQTRGEMQEGDYFVGSPDGDLHQYEGEGTSVTIAHKVDGYDYVWRDHRTKITTPAAETKGDS